jgi:iron donor protein CyaY
MTKLSTKPPVSVNVEILAFIMNDPVHFGRHASETLHALHRAVLPAADDFGFDVDFDSGVLTLEFDKPSGKIVVLPHSTASQVWISDGAKNQKLDWDIVENDFVLESTGQTLKELLEEAISRRVGDDVSL